MRKEYIKPTVMAIDFSDSEIICTSPDPQQRMLDVGFGEKLSDDEIEGD